MALEKLSKEGIAKEFAFRLLYKAATELSAVVLFIAANSLGAAFVVDVVVGAVNEKNRKNTEVKKL